jgi:alpha-galactosidase
VGDTLNPGGVFRGLRVLPALVAVAKEMERRCPKALLLNYVNPMSINTWALSKVAKIKTYGLCHSVQHTASNIAGYIGAKPEELDYFVAGVNHQAFFLKLEREGVDMYPALREAMKDPEKYNKDKVRFEMLRHFDYFVTEGSGHNSEYNQYFRKRDDLIEKYCMSSRQDGPDGDPGHRMSAGEPGSALTLCAFLQKRSEREVADLLSGKKELDVKSSAEYGMRIVSAIETGVVASANINVMNDGLIDNLPQGCCVEVPCLLDGAGVHPCKVGSMPSQLAALNRGMINVQTLAVEGFLEQDRRKIFHAVAADPLASAVCSLDELQKMTDELFEKLAPALSF